MQRAGHLSLAAPDSGVITLNITTAGYPGDKPSGTMWQSKCSGVQFDFTGAGFRNGGSCGTQVGPLDGQFSWMTDILLNYS